MSENNKTFEQKVEEILAIAYRGIHHVREWRKRKLLGPRCIEVNIYSGIATYDFDELTRLVVACHDNAVRMEIQGSGPRLLKLFFTERVSKAPGVYMTEYHPSIEQAIEAIRKGDGQP